MPRACPDLTGKRHNRWMVLGPASTRNRHKYWLCRCDCGVVKAVSQCHLLSGKSFSCGCFRSDVIRATAHTWARTHGLTKTATYRAWSQAKTRCSNPRDRNYADYGGRGISMCSRWANSFEAFLADVGESPGKAYSIDRINNNGNYEPGNVRWATDLQQAQNKRGVRAVEINGEIACVAEWCRHLGIPRARVWSRLHKGWSPAEALTLPLRGRRSS